MPPGCGVKRETHPLGLLPSVEEALKLPTAMLPGGAFRDQLANARIEGVRGIRSLGKVEQPGR